MNLTAEVGMTIAYLAIIHKSLEVERRLPTWASRFKQASIIPIAWYLLAQVPGFTFLGDLYGEVAYCTLLGLVWLLQERPSDRLFLVALYPVGITGIVNAIAGLAPAESFSWVQTLAETAHIFAKFWMIGFTAYAFNESKKYQKVSQKEQLERQIATHRKAELEALVSERTLELTTQKETLERTLLELQAAQTQLVHSEKMASLGELTAGIAHEIQNPLNFVNNFAELSMELTEELRDELAKPNADKELISELTRDLIQNQEKINFHGKRAARIVSGMLQHARTNADAHKEPVDMNALVDEYLRLSYHGLRAKIKDFNATMITNYDPKLGKVMVVQQDMGRVFLNLINNAFYAVQQRERRTRAQDIPSLQAALGNKEIMPNYQPTVTVSTKQRGQEVIVRIQDNGTGIPENVRDRIFQPFFTTKPTGEGTGLGLSLSFDIVTKGHGGKLTVDTEEGKGTIFSIHLPIGGAASIA